MPAQQRKTSKKREGPNWSHVLLRSIKRAIQAGVDTERIIMMIDMADEATGTEQAPAWRNVTRTLNRWSSEKDGQPANQDEPVSGDTSVEG